MFEITSAYILDLIFGDPQWRWHPVRIIGRLIETLEQKLNADKPVRQWFGFPHSQSHNINKTASGIILVILVVGLTISCVWFTLKLAKFIHPFLYHTLFVLLIYFALSIKSLSTEAKKVYLALKNNNIQKARNDLSMIVGRDTDKLNEPEIIRASVETVAESIMDGIIAPLFYAFIGGPILIWAYKAINTLDSMVGYRSERFIDFGKPAAKLDGVVNFIPAKITCFLISASGFFYGKDWFNSFKWGLKYFFNGQEFNSIATEAAMAGALKIQLGGINYYKTIAVSKPLVGKSFYPLDKKHIIVSIRISYICSVLFLLLALLTILGRG